MQVRINTSNDQITGPGIQTQIKAGEQAGQKSAKVKKSQTIFAGDLPMNKDAVMIRRQQAQKKAMKMIQDAWNGDRKTDQGIAETRERAQQQREEAIVNQERIAECDARIEKMREGYGVDMDSQEQKDLELLDKAATTDPKKLTEEERQRLEELENQPLTEYQKNVLEINKEKRIFENRLENAQTGTAVYSSAATDMRIERLKFHKMTDAQNNADKLMEETGKEIVGMLWEEAKDHVDETYEEKREEAKKKEEEKEEQEEKIEDIRENQEMIEKQIETVREDSHETEEARREQEKDARNEAELLKDMADAGLDVAGAGAGVKAEIKDMLQKMKLLEADIKGIEVDEEV